MDLGYLNFLLGLLICSRSFAIMAVPFGLSTTLYITLIDGQSVTILWGWALVSLISLAIAAPLAEICAVYPIAGGVYYWSAMLSTKKYAPIASWITGWLTLVGNWTVTCSINFSGSTYIISHYTLERRFRAKPVPSYPHVLGCNGCSYAD